MTRKTRRPTRTPARPTPITPRAVLLAGVGAVSLGRKQVAAAAEALASLPGTLGAKACALADEARERALQARKQARARLAPVRKQVEKVAAQAEAEFQARFGPLLSRVGAGPVGPSRRKPGTRRAGAPARKAVRRRA